VVVLQCPSPDAASTSLTHELVTTQLEDESATVEEEGGIGDRAYWGATDHSAAYVLLRRSRLVAMALGGEGFQGAPHHRTALRKVAEAAAGRMAVRRVRASGYAAGSAGAQADDHRLLAGLAGSKVRPPGL
jgi:hypothetical protein